ncbi:MAG TPA: inorganic phosphate transporter [Alphaproteobacteria bacterium]
MADQLFTLLAVVVILTLIFDYINGFHDAANAIATVVSTRALSPIVAVTYGAVLNLAGALIGTKVAATIGSGLVQTNALTIHTVLFTVIGAIIWNLITWYKGLPTSSSHAIIGSLLGAAYFSAPGTEDSILWGKLTEKVLVPMIASPVLGICGGFLMMLTVLWVVRKLTPHTVNRAFSKLQIFSSGFMALNHGHNDAQKSMGIIALALMLSNPGQEFHVPTWVIVSCAVAMGLGTMSGGWRIIRTLGGKMMHLDPAHGFAAEMTASTIIAGASHFGIPVSTTHVITTSIMGVGTTQRLSAVRWGVVGNIVWAWVLTIPLTFALSGTLMWLYRALSS